MIAASPVTHSVHGPSPGAQSSGPIFSHVLELGLGTLTVSRSSLAILVNTAMRVGMVFPVALLPGAAEASPRIPLQRFIDRAMPTMTMSRA